MAAIKSRQSPTPATRGATSLAGRGGGGTLEPSTVIFLPYVDQ